MFYLFTPQVFERKANVLSRGMPAALQLYTNSHYPATAMTAVSQGTSGLKCSQDVWEASYLLNLQAQPSQVLSQVAASTLILLHVLLHRQTQM